MRLALYAAGFLLLAGSAFAAPVTVIQDPSNVNRNMAVNADGSINVSGTISATNPSVGTNGAATPTSSTATGYQNGSGNLIQDSTSNPHPVVDSALATIAGQGVGSTGSAVPAQAIYMGANGAGNLTGIIQATASAAISFTAAGGPTQIIGASGSTKIYVTHIHYVLSGAGTFALVTGTGTNCGTNTAYLEGASSHPLAYAANGGISAGGGLGPIYVTGAGGEICAITTGSVDTSGTISYTQF